MLKAALALPPGASHWWRQSQPVDARQRYLLGLVYQRLLEERYQGAELETLRKLQLTIWGRHTQLEKAAREVLDALQAAGIRAVLLKGMALVCSLQAPVARALADFDVLIGAADLEAAAELLERQRWLPDQALPCPSRRKIMHGLSWRRSGFSLDLHWQLMPECLDPELDAGVLSRATTVSLRARPALALEPTDLLMHTVVHGCKRGSGDGWVLDSCLLLKTTPVDWARFLEQCQQRRITLQCRVGLEFLAREMQARVPEKILRSLESFPVTRMDRLYFSIKGYRRRLWTLWLWPVLEYLRLPACQRPPGFLAYLRLRWSVKGPLLPEALRRLLTYLRGANG